MVAPEDSALYWEKVGYENRARWLQVGAIFKSVEDRYFTRIVDDNDSFLELVNSRSNISANNPDGIRLQEVVKSCFKLSHVFHMVNDIHTFLLNSPTATKEFFLDVKHPVLTVSVNSRTGEQRSADVNTLLLESFPTMGFELGQAIQAGWTEANSEILTLFQGPVELLAYRRDLLPAISGQKTLTRGLAYRFPTKVEGISAKMIYENGKRIPSVSLVVEPLTQVSPGQ